MREPMVYVAVRLARREIRRLDALRAALLPTEPRVAVLRLAMLRGAEVLERSVDAARRSRR